MMEKFGLIGRRLGHSFSQQLFEDRFGEGRYGLYEMEDLDGIKALDLNGFNVTIPYKMAILPLLDEVDGEAREIGAVNCVCREGGRLIGHNTDWRAFEETLLPLLQPWHTRALILGRGGAARAVAYALKRLGIDCLMRGRDESASPSPAPLIVNCTPVGMVPMEALTPWPEAEAITPRHLCYDLVYNPTQTCFLREAAAHGAQTQNGLPMLRRQAELSWMWWGLLPQA